MDANNVCKMCDATCEIGYCTEGANNFKCTKCVNSLFLNSTHNCIASVNCPNYS